MPRRELVHNQRFQHEQQQGDKTDMMATATKTAAEKTQVPTPPCSRSCSLFVSLSSLDGMHTSRKKKKNSLARDTRCTHLADIPGLAGLRLVLHLRQPPRPRQGHPQVAVQLLGKRNGFGWWWRRRSRRRRRPGRRGGGLRRRRLGEAVGEFLVGPLSGPGQRRVEPLP